MDNSNDTQWMHISDIMSALMMIFMFISITFLYELLSKKDIYRLNLNKALHKEFDKDLKKWKAIITEDNIIRFNAPFKIGSDKIEDNFKKILLEFFPRYIKVLSNKQFKNEIDEIRVEGHTSNVWKNVNLKESYLFNMNLSQRRASKVLAFCYNINSDIIKKNIFWLQKHLRANGMSFAKLLYKDTSRKIPDNIRSRRVEFKVLTKEK